MYEETKVRFNWKGLFIKLLIITLILILIIVLFKLVIKKSDGYSKDFKNNITELKSVGGNYFNEDNLPKEVGDSIKVTLNDLVENKKIKSLKVNGKKCNEVNSYIKIVKKSKGYELESTLICGEEKNTSYTYLGCIDNCNQVSTTLSTSTTTTTTTTTSTTKRVTTVKPTTSASTTTITTTTVKYAVIFNRNMGSNVTTIYVNSGDVISKPADPVREGYVFAGWYYNDSLFDFNTKVNKNIILIAKWDRK